jgi:hypothetical protein
MTAGLQLRERFEIWNGYNKKAYGDDSIDPGGKERGSSSDTALIQRIIFGIGGENRYLAWKAYLYDSRSWGTSLDTKDFVKNPDSSQEHVMDPYEDYLEPYEFYVKFKGIGTDQSFLMLGRQIIGYGDNRIFGPGAVTNSVGWIWDAARYSLRGRENFLDIWYGETKDQDPDSFSMFERHPFHGVGIYGHWHASDYITMEPFFAWKRGRYFNNGKKENSYYFGARFYRRDRNGLAYDITMSKRMGYYIKKDGPNIDIDAQGYAIKVGWFFKNAPFSPELLLARIYASGDSDDNDMESNTFARPFGTTDGGFYGIMDLVSWSNMIDNQVDLYLDIWPGYRLRLCYHDFHLDKKNDKWAYFGYGIENNRYDHVGNEIDIVLTGKPYKWLDIMLFYGHFRAGNFVTKNDIAQNNADRAVLQLVFHFNTIKLP